MLLCELKIDSYSNGGGFRLGVCDGILLEVRAGLPPAPFLPVWVCGAQASQYLYLSVIFDTEVT